MMNVFILTDIEGIPGVTSIDQIDRSTEQYKVTRMKLCRAVNLVVSLCRKNGADLIYCLDGHGGGGNVIPELLDEDIEMIDLHTLDALLAAGKIDAAVELGAHARAGTVGGFLDHTTNSRMFFKYTCNGTEYSELAMHAALYGAYDVPLVACIGDEAACEQAKEYVPHIVTAAVKKAEKRNECTDYPDADERIAACVDEALKKRSSIKPVKIQTPCTLSLTYYRTDYCEEALARIGEGVTRTDARTLTKTVDAITSYFDFRF